MASCGIMSRQPKPLNNAVNYMLIVVNDLEIARIRASDDDNSKNLRILLKETAIKPTITYLAEETGTSRAG